MMHPSRQAYVEEAEVSLIPISKATNPFMTFWALFHFAHALHISLRPG